MRHIRISCLGAVLVAACTLQHAADANKAQKEMIGMTRVQVFQCAGVPNRTASEGGLDYLVYSAAQTIPYRGGDISENCDATFVLKNDVVIRVMYRGDTGSVYTKGRACYPIIEFCVK